MRKKSLENLYPYLKPEERFRLVLEALKRGDESEVRRLSESCPTEVYRERDKRFTELVEASHKTACTFTVLWLETCRRLQAANTPETVAKWVMALRGLWRALRAFCHDMKLDWEAVLAWCPAMREEIKALGMEHLEEEPLDWRMEEEAYTLFLSFWPPSYRPNEREKGVVGMKA